MVISLKLAAERLVQQGLLQGVEGGELALVEGESFSFSFEHGYLRFALKHLTK